MNVWYMRYTHIYNKAVRFIFLAHRACQCQCQCMAWHGDRLRVLGMLIDRYTTDISFWSDIVTHSHQNYCWKWQKCIFGGVFMSGQLKENTDTLLITNIIYGYNLMSKVHYLCTFDAPPLAKKLAAFWAISWQGTWLGYYFVSSNHPPTLVSPNKEAQDLGIPSKNWLSHNATTFWAHYFSIFFWGQSWHEFRFVWLLQISKLEKSCKEKRREELGLTKPVSWDSSGPIMRFIIMWGATIVVGLVLRHESALKRCGAVDQNLMRRCFSMSENMVDCPREERRRIGQPVWRWLLSWAHYYYWSWKPESNWPWSEKNIPSSETRVGVFLRNQNCKWSTTEQKMLKVSNVGRGRTNSFSLLDPSTPTPTPSSSYIPDTLLENRMVGLNNVGSEELLRAAEQFLLQPTRTEAKDAKEATRLRLVQEMCSEFLLTDEQLQHIEERMVMEVRDQISSSDLNNMIFH